MYLIVGLGNPGKKYEQTRHNIGFMAVDAILNSYGSNDKPKKKFSSVIHELQLENKKVIIVKPETYMNNSGDAIIQIVNYFKIKTENILILHDPYSGYHSLIDDQRVVGVIPQVVLNDLVLSYFYQK